MFKQNKMLFLDNLPDGIGETDIRKRFDRFGQVSSVEIKVKKINDGKESSTFAFVELATSPRQLDECKSVKTLKIHKFYLFIPLFLYLLKVLL